MRLHIVKATIETTNKLGFEMLKHLAYSTDLATSDYHPFAPLKDLLRGSKLSSDEAVQNALHKWLRGHPKTFSYLAFISLSTAETSAWK